MTEKPERYAVEQAFAFFHQKERVYSHSTSEREMDHIEDSIASYVNSMSPVLYRIISEGNPGFLREHVSFREDISAALARLEALMA